MKNSKFKKIAIATLIYFLAIALLYPLFLGIVNLLSLIANRINFGVGLYGIFIFFLFLQFLPLLLAASDVVFFIVYLTSLAKSQVKTAINSLCLLCDAIICSSYVYLWFKNGEKISISIKITSAVVISLGAYIIFRYAYLLAHIVAKEEKPEREQDQPQNALETPEGKNCPETDI